MFKEFRLNDEITLDVNRILSVVSVKNGVRLTYIDRQTETLSNLSETERNRLFDFWFGM